MFSSPFSFADRFRDNNLNPHRYSSHFYFLYWRILIPFNTFSLSNYERPSNSSVSNFRKILKDAGYTVTVRTTRADDIGAACGQLVGDVADQTSRSNRYKKRFPREIQSSNIDRNLVAVAEKM